MSSTKSATGQCLCGSVSYTIHADEPLRMAQCHCKDCQRSSGGGHMSLAFFKADDVEFKGEMSSYGAKAASGNINTRHFCPKCGSPLSFESTRWPGELHLYAASLDDPSDYVPDLHCHHAEHLPWLHIADDLPKHRGSAE